MDVGTVAKIVYLFGSEVYQDVATLAVVLFLLI